MMLAIDWLKANARGPYVVEPIRMIRQEEVKPCSDYRPGDRYLRGADAPANHGCGHQHVQKRICKHPPKRKHHQASCYAWFHICVETDGWLFTDGRFVARVFADALAPRGACWQKTVFHATVPKFRRQDIDIDVDAIRALAGVAGIECAEVLDTEPQTVVASAQEATP